MVAEVKVKTNNISGLDSLIKKFVGETKREYVYEETVHRKSFVDKSVQKLVDNSIIEGYFPKENLVRDMAIKKVNKLLCILLGILVTVVIASYYFVITCDMKLNELSRQTVIINNENEELQNKLDSLKSFNNVDKTLQQNNLLQRPGQVIETQEVLDSGNDVQKNTSRRNVFNHAIGF